MRTRNGRQQEICTHSDHPGARYASQNQLTLNGIEGLQLLITEGTKHNIKDYY